MEIQFIGAARTVTGSMHLIRTNGTTFLLDCGLYQGKRKEAYEINKNFDLFDPAKIDCYPISCPYRSRRKHPEPGKKRI